MFNEEQVENALIEQLQELGYKYQYAPDMERDYKEVILKEEFYESLFRINKGITQDIADEVYRKIRTFTNVELIQANQEFHKMLYGGVEIPMQGDRTYTAYLIDKENIENNSFLVVNQYTIEEYKTKRPDMIVFINGIPLVVFELKNAMKEDTTIENAYNQIKNYQQDIKSLFFYNAFNVICDGVNARVGTITADFTRYMTWKSKNGENPEAIFDQVDTLLDGVFRKERLVDLIFNFIVFQKQEKTTIKILAGYHQYFAVRKAIKSTKKALTERNTFSTCNKEILPQTCKNASNRNELKELLKVNAGGIIFTTIQKFEEGTDTLSERENIIFIADEAHRSQYGLTAKFNST